MCIGGSFLLWKLTWTWNWGPAFKSQLCPLQPMSPLISHCIPLWDTVSSSIKEECGYRLKDLNHVGPWNVALSECLCQSEIFSRDGRECAKLKLILRRECIWILVGQAGQPYSHPLSNGIENICSWKNSGLPPSAAGTEIFAMMVPSLGQSILTLDFRLKLMGSRQDR